MILITCHRRENFGSVLENICYMIRRLCTRYPNYHWVFPVHLNPNVKEPVYRLLSNIENLSLLPPVDYLTSLQLIAGSCLVVTDSGGIQEEAPSFGIPVVVMRSFTERMEGMYAGVASLAGQEPAAIEAEIDKWLSLVELPEALIQKVSPYGDGKASDRIIKGLLDQTTDEFIFSVPAR
jgi:UDP-N-acetylglucosamine 2-epimerase (non-hydrolysing)